MSAFELGSARKWAEEIRKAALFPGAVAIDATMGNGGDTAHLASLVGETGRVYAFDVQEEALIRTQKRLEEENLLSRVSLILDGHQNMAKYVRESVDCIVFNLGWLPNAAHEVFTRVDTTIPALDAALSLLKKGGVLTVCVYPGHEEGAREYEAVRAWAEQLPPKIFQSRATLYCNQPKNTPALFAVQRIGF